MSNFLFINPATGFMGECEINSNVIATVDLEEPAAAQGGSGTPKQGMGIIWLVVLMVLMLAFMRPRKDKEGEKFRNSLQEGQEVVTGSGIVGTVKSVDDLFVVIEINQNNRIKLDKRYVNPLPTPAPVAEKKKKEKDNKSEK